MVCDTWYFEREMRVEFRNDIKIIPDYPKHAVAEIWFNPLQINLELKQLFCSSHRQPIYNVAFHFKEVPLSLPRNKTVILISGCMAYSAVFLCFYGIPTPCVTTYKPRQTWKTIPGSRGPFSKWLIWNKPCLRFDKAPSLLLSALRASLTRLRRDWSDRYR